MNPVICCRVTVLSRVISESWKGRSELRASTLHFAQRLPSFQDSWSAVRCRESRTPFATNSSKDKKNPTKTEWISTGFKRSLVEQLSIYFVQQWECHQSEKKNAFIFPNYKKTDMIYETNMSFFDYSTPKSYQSRVCVSFVHPPPKKGCQNDPQCNSDPGFLGSTFFIGWILRGRINQLKQPRRNTTFTQRCGQHLEAQSSLILFKQWKRKQPRPNHYNHLTQQQMKVLCFIHHARPRNIEKHMW